LLDARYFYTANVSLAASHFAKGARFDTTFPSAAFEDIELGSRLVDAGLRIVYCSAALGLHLHPYDLRSFVERQLKAGRMASVAARLRPELKYAVGFRELVFRRWMLTLFGARAIVEPGGALVPLARAEEETLRYLDQFAERPVVGLEELYRGVFRYFYLKGLFEETAPPRLDDLLVLTLLAHVAAPFRRVEAAFSKEGLPPPPPWLRASAERLAPAALVEAVARGIVRGARLIRSRR